MPSTAPGYAELHCLSNFSFLTGASHPQELVRRAHELGYAALALTDECSLAGVVRAHVEARDCGLALIPGSDIRLTDGPRLVVLAADREGYGDLSELITRGRRRAGKGACELARADLTAGFEGCLALWLPSGDPDPADGGWLAERFPGRAWIGVELHRSGRDRAWLETLSGLSAQCGLPLVACGGALMHERGRRALQDTLTAVRLGVPLAEAGHALQPNAERHLRGRAGLARLYPSELLAETLEVARRCTFSLEELRYEYPDELVPPGRDPGARLRELTEQGLQRRWPGGEPAKVRRLVEHELSLIAELRYEPYFLTVHDIVRFARSRGILCQGRGSAANSAVCYALGITEVDPARMELLFERFISRERDEPPDIDVDFEHQRREEVIQYVYARYGRDRAALAATVISYRPKSAVRDVGKALGLDLDQVDRLAHNLTWWDGGTIDPERVREAGLDPGNPLLRRVLVMSREILGFPRHLSQHVGGFVISRGPLSRLVPIENAAMAERTVIQWDKDDLEALGLLKVDCLALGMLSAVRRAFDLINAYRGWSERPSRRDTEAQMDSRSASAPAGGAGTVGAAVSREPGGPGPGTGASGHGGSRSASAPAGGAGTVGAAASREPDGLQPGSKNPPGPGNPLGLHNVPPEDPAVYAMIRRADTLGVFQIESRAQMAMLPRLRPERFYDLVIEVAIVRPGPIQGDMVHPYLKRRQGLEEVTYPSEAVREVLGRTLGVPIFQEQVIKVAMVAAGFSPGEADRLRRSIAAWRRRGTLEQFEDRLIRGMTERGYDEAFARRIYQQILGFGEYGFPESHAASFALLVYVSAWLKCHEPAAFFAALLNSQPMGFYAPAQLVQAARRAGVEVLAVDVHTSDGDCTLEPSRAGAASPPAMRLGLLMVKGLSRAGAARLLAARAQRRFRDVQDLARRARLDRRDLESLAAADALAGLAGDRHRAAWEVTGVQTPLPLFDLPTDAAPPGRPTDAGQVPDLPAPTEGQAILADYASLGLTLRRHPLALLRRQLSRRGLLCARDLDGLRHGDRVRTGGLVINRQRPASANNVTFVTLEDETGQINLVIWRQVADRQRLVMLNARLLGVVGDVQREGGVLHVVARRLLDHSDLLGRLPTRSRDFR
jgi:error-prone DNA polymerase